jgi:AraC family transcriptional regulator, activator of mtrCDE
MKAPLLRISRASLDKLIDALDVRFVSLSECVVSAGYRLQLEGLEVPGIHYNLTGYGRIVIGNDPPIELQPHKLVIVPPRCRFRLEVPASARQSYDALTTVVGSIPITAQDGIRRFVAGEGAAEIILICGYFHAAYGAATDLFAMLAQPIIEQFDPREQLDTRLKQAMKELISQEIGSASMSASLLKQILIAVLRRSLTSINLWVERFAMLSDPQIALAFAEMAAHPGGRHSLTSLAKIARLGRSLFAARFVKVVGRSPIVVLRDLRMRQAARQLRITESGVDQIAREAGYASRTSFVRAFRRVYGTEPSLYRDGLTRDAAGGSARRSRRSNPTRSRGR